MCATAEMRLQRRLAPHSFRFVLVNSDRRPAPSGSSGDAQQTGRRARRCVARALQSSADVDGQLLDLSARCPQRQPVPPSSHTSDVGRGGCQRRRAARGSHRRSPQSYASASRTPSAVATAVSSIATIVSPERARQHRAAGHRALAPRNRAAVQQAPRKQDRGSKR